MTRLIVGLIGLFIAAAWIGLTDNTLPHVPAIDQRVFEPTQSITWGIVAILVMALGVAAVAGAWTVGRIDVGQALAAGWAGFWLYASIDLLYSVQFSGPGAVCTYDSCWPSPYQELLVAAPVGAALIVMVILALAGRPSRALLRGAIPALVLLGLTAVQQLAWRNWVLPVLLGPPPF